MAVKQMGVIFGGRSCEREVSIISALQMMRYVDPEKYQVVPVYIHEDGGWYTGDVLKEIACYQPFHSDRAGLRKVFLDLTPGSGALLSLRRENGLFRKSELEIVARVDLFMIVMNPHEAVFSRRGFTCSARAQLQQASVPAGAGCRAY